MSTVLVEIFPVRTYTGVNKIMETLRNRGIGFVLATLGELQLASLNVFPFAYARGSALVIVLGDSLVKESENGRLVQFLKKTSLVRV
jgi:hypothetical protein